jgi:cytochrome c oxidase subunit II
MFTSLWFEPVRRDRSRPLVYDIYCTEYCGAPEEDATPEQLRQDGRPMSAAGHSGMLSRIHIVSREEWTEYVDRLVNIPPQYNNDFAAWGADLFAAGGRCTACHVTEAGAAHTTGPNLANVAGYPQPLATGGEVMADLEYIRRSIREPGADVVQGYPNVMSSFAQLHELQIDALTAYVASLSDRGQSIVEEIQALHPPRAEQE